MDILIRNFLLSLGFNPGKSGYFMLISILKHGMLGHSLEPFSKNAYVRVSEEMQKSVPTVEKDIQNAIFEAWKSGKLAALNDKFAGTFDIAVEKPTNKYFVAAALNELRAYMN